MTLGMKTLKYASHMPVLQSIIDIFMPISALELGPGKFSTEILYKNIHTFISVENGKTWYDWVKNSFPSRDGFDLIYHEIGKSVDKGKDYFCLSKQDRRRARNYYIQLRERVKGFDLLFADQYTSVREMSLSCLYDLFKIIVFHDSVDKEYNYENFFKNDLGSYNIWRYRVFDVSTDFLINKKYSILDKELIGSIEKTTENFCMLYAKKSNKLIFNIEKIQ